MGESVGESVSVGDGVGEGKSVGGGDGVGGSVGEVVGKGVCECVSVGDGVGAGESVGRRACVSHVARRTLHVAPRAPSIPEFGYDMHLRGVWHCVPRPRHVW